jgi:predicted transposase YbfD/YdcC
MLSEQKLTIETHFVHLQDPRIEGMKRHNLLDIVTITLCAVICGAEHWTQIETFGETHQGWFSEFLELPEGIPSHDTFGRLFAHISPLEFERCFESWFSSIIDTLGPQVIGVDGKVLRHSYDRSSNKAAIHMVSAWATENRLILGQIKVEEGSNEITAVPPLLRALAIKGCIVTLDALHCQKETAEVIIEQGADYVIALKRNQEKLYNQVIEYFDEILVDDPESDTLDFYLTEERGHGREEVRRYWTTERLDWLKGKEDWRELRSVGIVERECWIGDKKSYGYRLYISSLPADAQQLERAVRGHWQIENSVHWSLDVAFREDDCRIRKGHSAQNMSVLRRMSLNLLRHEKTEKGGIKTKRLRAAWDRNYLIKVLFSLSN